MTYSTQARSSTATRPWALLHLPSYAHSGSTRTTPNTRARLRKRDATPSRRSNTLPLDWLAASGIGIKVALDVCPGRKLCAGLRGTLGLVFVHSVPSLRHCPGRDPIRP